MSTALAGQVAAQRFVLQPTDVEFSTGNRAQQDVVIAIEQVETGIGPSLLLNGTREFVEFVPASPGVFDRGEELEIAAVGCLQQLAQCRQAVDGLLHGGPFDFA